MTDIIVPQLVRIEAGSFLMGSDGGRGDEAPVHRVELGAFEIGAWQVTNEEYDVFVARTGHLPAPHRDDARFCDPRQPVVAVSWFDAVDYCAWLAAMTGRLFRLPTEAEWERAARGGLEGRLYPWGDPSPQSRPGYDRRWIDGPERCAGGEPNGFGLYDMCENVHEWCGDWYRPDAYARSRFDPCGPELGSRRASRGGSWRHHVKVSRCAARSSLPPDRVYNDYGFRVACGV